MTDQYRDQVARAIWMAMTHGTAAQWAALVALPKDSPGRMQVHRAFHAADTIAKIPKPERMVPRRHAIAQIPSQQRNES